MKENTVFAIGALGGSGTRAVAQVFREMGIYMGDDLNKPLDNLLFSRLFKNPQWYNKASKAEVENRLRIFKDYMQNETLRAEDKHEIFAAAKSNYLVGAGLKYYWTFYKNYWFRKPLQNNMWGWKEPNTLIFIPEIVAFFPNLKYVHVIRHGLDMAFSKNIQQLTNWGYLFDIQINDTDNAAQVAKKQLDYWIKANTTAIENGRKLLDDRFYLLNHNDFCNNPEEEVKRLVEFIGKPIDEELLNQLIQIPSVPDTTKRYLKNDMSMFSDEDLKAVEALGFTI